MDQTRRPTPSDHETMPDNQSMARLVNEFALAFFLRGMGRGMDLGSTLRAARLLSLPPDMLDRLAMRSDWLAVGEDLWWAMERFARDESLPPPEAIAKEK